MVDSPDAGGVIPGTKENDKKVRANIYTVSKFEPEIIYYTETKM
jgi:hypothetical protein